MTDPRPLIEPGIYFGLPEHEYHAAAGLSNTGIKHLAVDPLNYWHYNLNPDREQPEQTPAQRWGRAVHCRLLEPERFPGAYAVKLCKADHPDALDTDDDLKAWLVEHGLPVTGKRKQERVDRIRVSGRPAVIWDDLAAEFARRTEGMELISRSEMAHLDRLAEVVLGGPFARVLLADGVSEVSIFVRDPGTGVMLKARLDRVKPSATVDVKTFSNSRGKPTDKVVFDAIYYEGYYQQAIFYHRVRELARRQLAAGEIQTHGPVSEQWLKGYVENADHAFGFVFVESSEPFALRIVQIKRAERPGAEPNVYWQAGEMQIEDMTRLYAECWERYGDAPWRDPAKPRVLQDADLPQLMFA